MTTDETKLARLRRILERTQSRIILRGYAGELLAAELGYRVSLGEISDLARRAGWQVGQKHGEVALLAPHRRSV